MAMYGKNLRRNKKGSLIDIVFIGIAITFFSMVVLIGLKVATEVEANIDSNSLFDGSEAGVQVENVRVKYTNTVDNTFLFLMIGIALATLVLAALVRIHPIFIPFYFIGLIFVIFLSGVLSNIYQSMAASSELSGIASQLTLMNGILVALPIIVGVFGIILMVVMYKLWSAAQV